MKGKEKKSQFK